VAGTGSDLLTLAFLAAAFAGVFRFLAAALAGAFRLFVAMDSSFPTRLARLSNDLRELFFSGRLRAGDMPVR
jgi:hypothetical protein